jgi:hypothetical protein
MSFQAHSLLCVGGPADGQRRLVTAGTTLVLEYFVDGRPASFDYHRRGHFVDGMRIDLWVHGDPGLDILGGAIAAERLRANELGLLISGDEPAKAHPKRR